MLTLRFICSLSLAYCRNTEFEESSSDTDCYIDEYEIASFDEQEQKQSDEGDSDIEVRNISTSRKHDGIRGIGLKLGVWEKEIF